MTKILNIVLFSLLIFGIMIPISASASTLNEPTDEERELTWEEYYELKDKIMKGESKVSLEVLEEFKSMTRMEYAKVVYDAMKEGVNIREDVFREYEPELVRLAERDKE